MISTAEGALNEVSALLLDSQELVVAAANDAGMTVEVSTLTRAQILVQSTQSTLQIANAIPTSVLSLLGRVNPHLSQPRRRTDKR